MVKAEIQVKDWNNRYKIGQRVKVRKDLGEVVETATRSEAQILPSGTAVIWVEGIAGCYLLDRVTALCIPPPGVDEDTWCKLGEEDRLGEIKGKCYFCQESTDGNNWCFGCEVFICGKCDQIEPLWPHKPEDHK